MNRIVLTFALLGALGAASSAQKDSMTINGVTFDFGAPTAPLTRAESDFSARYIQAINGRSAAALLALEDESKKTCKIDGDQILLRNLKQDVIPPNAKIRFFKMDTDFTKLFGMSDLAYIPVKPTAILGISYGSEANEKIISRDVLQPVREADGRITIVPYCLTEKGSQMLH